MATTFKRDLLLTGAGFTANFGGLLAREMWSKILNNKKMDGLPSIKGLLRNNFDFESVYAEVKRTHTITPEEKKLFQEVILDSYTSMDEGLKHYHSTGSDAFGVNIGGVTSFIGSFAGKGQETGAHFTLNQDLFLERQIHAVTLPPNFGHGFETRLFVRISVI